MLRLHNVDKTYKVHGVTRAVLRNVNATFQKGEAVGILGRNGAGKSTLLRIIAGVEYPNRGQVERQMSISWPLGFAGAMHYMMTGADNARFVARIYQKNVSETVDFVESFAELGAYYRVPVKTYSSGMITRLGFALSLAVDFDCYLVDEVLAVGDSRFAERCRQAMLERRGRSTLLLVSHQPSTVRALCTSAAVLHDGNLTRYDDVDRGVAVYEEL